MCVYVCVYILYTYSVSRVTYTDKYRACISGRALASSDTSSMSLYMSPY